MARKTEAPTTETTTSTTTSKTTSTSTQTTAAPDHGYKKEEVAKWYKDHDARIWKVKPLEEAVPVFADVLPYWIACADCDEAQDIFTKVRVQWENLRRSHVGVPPLPDDPTTALIWLNTVQQQAGKDGRLPEKWPDANQKHVREQTETGGAGRKRKYNPQTLELAEKAYHAQVEQTNDSKAAWESVAELYGFPSGDAARKAVTRHKSGQNGQNHSVR